MEHALSKEKVILLQQKKAVNDAPTPFSRFSEDFFRADYLKITILHLKQNINNPLN